MKRYEKVALALMVPGMALTLALALCSDADLLAGATLWPCGMLAVALMTAAIAVVKRGWEKDTGKKAVLFFDLGAKKDPTE